MLDFGTLHSDLLVKTLILNLSQNIQAAAMLMHMYTLLNSCSLCVFQPVYQHYINKTYHGVAQFFVLWWVTWKTINWSLNGICDHLHSNDSRGCYSSIWDDIEWQHITNYKLLSTAILFTSCTLFTLFNHCIEGFQHFGRGWFSKSARTFWKNGTSEK